MFKMQSEKPCLTVRLLRSREEKAPLAIPAQDEKIPFLGYDLLEHRCFLTAFQGEKVVGVVSLVMDSHRIPGALGVGFVSTHSDHRNQGVSRTLVQALFELACQRRQAIANTSYEPDGDRWLRHVMHRTAKAYPQVEFFERDQSPAYA